METLKPDRITIWGMEECPNCQAVKEAFNNAGLAFDEKDLQKELENEPSGLRSEIMATYCSVGAAPIIQVNDRALTVLEALHILDLD